jgi:hypothetical protein
MNNALAIISKARGEGALVFAPQNLDVPPLYKAEATIITARPDEFHNMQGKFMPNKAVVDRIGEAAGVDFIAAQCSVRTETRDDDIGRRTIFVGYAQGRTRLPDGSWRMSAVEDYEFDPLLRAQIEGKGNELSIRTKYLDYMKTARQRASTGARVRVIRQLTGMPVTFSQAEVSKPLVFSRIVQNTDYILGTKEGRAMAIAAAVGVTGQLFGSSRQPEQLAPQAPDEELRNVTPEPEDDWAEDLAPAIDPRVASLQAALGEYLAAGMLPESGRVAVQAALDRGENDPIILDDLARRAKAAHEKGLARARGGAA